MPKTTLQKQTKSPISWFGGKTKLASQIVALLPESRCFVDVFGGSAAVLLARGQSKSRIDAYNDIDSELVNLFRVLRDPVTAGMLQAQLEGTPYARAEFDLAKLPSEDPVEKARRFVVRQRMSHGGMGESFSFSLTEMNAGLPNSIHRYRTGVERLPLVASRCRDVIIEQSTWQKILERYDRPGTCLYMDPPYLDSTRIDGGYAHEMDTPDAHQELIDAILAAKSMIVLSGYPSELYAQLEAAGWSRKDIDVPAYTSDKRERRIESLWINPAAQRALAEQAAKAKAAEHPDLFEAEQRQVGMREGAYATHDARVSATEAKIAETIRSIKQSGQRIKMSDVATQVGISREQISRRYSHLFG